MKSFNRLLLLYLFANNLYLIPNILLQRPKQISKIELQELEKNWETEFIWSFGKGFNFICCYENGKASFLLQLLGMPIRSYNFEYLAHIKKFIKYYNKNYYFRKPLKFENANPKKINFDEFCNLLKNKTFIFYTGAGISAGNVHTMSQFEQSLKIAKDKKEFLKEIFINPKIITNEFGKFCHSAIYGSPTPAHFALHKIAQERNICILTENVDLLQQRTGILPIFTHSDSINQVKDNDFKEVDFIISVGLSHDDCGLLAYYKEKNPAGMIIAINLNKLNYLSDHDYLIQDDLQDVLCKLEKNLEIL